MYRNDSREEDSSITLEELNECFNLLVDCYKWEETPFRPSDDVVLLSYGFKYGSDQSYMFRVSGDGSVITVRIEMATPLWYYNGACIGTRTYDEVVNWLNGHTKL